eukprot:9635333-Lingulodinium_polyedra.AAC.1
MPIPVSAKVTAAFIAMEDAECASKRKVESGTRVKRHLQFPRRDVASVGTQAWRPRKRHIISAVKWIAYADNQHQVSHGGGGLQQLQPDWSKEAWSDKCWAAWPSAVFVCDQGGDGLSAIQAL